MRLAVYQPDIAPNLGAMIRICGCFDVALDVIEQQGQAIQDLLQTVANIPQGGKGGNINVFA